MLTNPKVNDTVYYIDPWISPTVQMGKIVAISKHDKANIHIIIDWIYPKQALESRIGSEDLFESPVDATHTYLKNTKKDLDNQMLQLLDKYPLGG